MQEQDTLGLGADTRREGQPAHERAFTISRTKESDVDRPTASGFVVRHHVNKLAGTTNPYNYCIWAQRHGTSFARLDEIKGTDKLNLGHLVHWVYEALDLDTMTPAEMFEEWPDAFPEWVIPHGRDGLAWIGQ